MESIVVSCFNVNHRGTSLLDPNSIRLLAGIDQPRPRRIECQVASSDGSLFFWGLFPGLPVPLAKEYPNDRLAPATLGAACFQRKKLAQVRVPVPHMSERRFGGENIVFASIPPCVCR